ncbi:MAG: ATP-binding protein [Bacteroidales bacterium]|jgi:AAA+ ATPase superfamily predicted ATPase|nr:ATP-binding protein [Bacteroidales bacterium]
MDNPFVFGAATHGQWFTDREKDAKRLSANFMHGINTIIISPRRWGKTSLVLKVAKELSEKKLKVVNIDIFSCRTQEDFYQIFAKEVIKQTSNKFEEWVENTKKFLSNLTPKISFGSEPTLDFELSIDFTNKQLNEDVLSLPQKIAESKNMKIVICIDEFQQISEFKDAVIFQKKLRSIWQLQSQTVSYCLFGSKKHLLNTLFSKPSMPFYKFGDIILLQKISTTDWINYICKRFKQTGKKIPETMAVKICYLVDNHSSYVQQLSWLVWIRTEKEVFENNIKTALDDLLNQNSILFYNYVEGLTSLQINFLRAIANGINKNFSHKEVLTKYNLGNSANIARIKKSLENKEIIDISNGIITFNDPVFLLWFKKEFGILS